MRSLHAHSSRRAYVLGVPLHRPHDSVELLLLVLDAFGDRLGLLVHSVEVVLCHALRPSLQDIQPRPYSLLRQGGTASMHAVQRIGEAARTRGQQSPHEAQEVQVPSARAPSSMFSAVRRRRPRRSPGPHASASAGGGPRWCRTAAPPWGLRRRGTMCTHRSGGTGVGGCLHVGGAQQAVGESPVFVKQCSSMRVMAAMSVALRGERSECNSNASMEYRRRGTYARGLLRSNLPPSARPRPLDGAGTGKRG